MKRCNLIVAALACAIFALAGCTAAQLGQTTSTLGGTPLQPVIVPATQPGGAPTVTEPTVTQAALNLGATAAADAAPIASAIPGWGWIVGGILTLASGILGVFASKQTSALSTLQNVVTAATPGISTLVQSATSNSAIAGDITGVLDAVPGVAALLSHPSASTVLASVGTVSAAIAAATPAVATSAAAK